MHIQIDTLKLNPRILTIDDIVNGNGVSFLYDLNLSTIPSYNNYKNQKVKFKQKLS